MTSRLLSLIVFRVVLICLVLGYQILATLFEYELMPFIEIFWLMFSLSLLSLSYVWLLYKRPELVRNSSNFVFLQFTIDIIAISIMVYYGDDLISGLRFAYLMVILLSALFLEKITIYALTIMSLAFYYFAMNIKVYIAQPDSHLGQLLQSEDISRAIIAQFVLCFLTALLSVFMQNTYRSSRQALKQTEQRISSLRETRRKIIETLPSGLIICDEEGVIIFINRVGMQFLEVNHWENLNAWEIFNLKPDPAHEQDAMTTYRARTERNVQVKGVKKIMGISYTTMETDRGNPGYMLVFQDLTKIKTLEAHRSLKDRMSAIGKVAAGVAHEIRNPLAAISGSIQVLKEMVPEDDSAQELAIIVDKETKRLNDIISEFLAYARPGPPPMFQPMILGECLKHFVTLLANDDRFQHLQISLDIHNEAETVIFGDEGKIEQVFWNLARNSATACEAEGQLVLGCYTQDEDVVFYLQDNGVGMDESQVKDLFTPFLSFRGGGTGLGMSIVYDIIKLHHGRINVTSNIGEGTRVEILFSKHRE